MNKVFTILTFIATLSAYSYTISVESSEISFEKISIGEDIQFDAVKLENGVVLPVAPGEPLLPAISVSVALPEGMAIDFIEVVYSDPVVLPGEYDIMPAQTPIPIGSKPAPFVKPDAEIYSMKTVYPGVDYITFASGNMSGYYMGNILVAPVQYIPASGEIVLYREIDFDPVFFGARGDTVYPRYRLDWIDSEMQRNLAANVINPEDISTPAGTTLIGYEDSSLDLYPYLIICPSSIATTAQDLAFWKTKKGLCAEVITTEFIDSNYSGVDIEEKTRNCIIDYFENQGTQYVCLITNDEPSSTGYIPMRVATIPKHLLGFPHDVPTDNYYGCLDGDWNADDDEFWGEANDEVDLLYDIFVGRLYAEDASDLANVINKTLCYEGTELSSEVNPYDYQDDVLLAGAIPDDSTDCWDISEYIQDEYMVSSYWDITGLHGVPFSTGVFINAANADKGFIGHAGHAEWDGIQSNTGGFEDQNDITKDHLYGLDNGPRYSGFLYSVGCQSADIDHFDNCASSFLRSPDGGGVGYIGNTREGRYTSGDILHSFSPLFEEEYFRQLCKPEAMGKGGLNVFKSGQTHAYHKNSLVSYIDEDVSYRWIYYTLYLTGDPDIWVHNDTVRPIYVAHQSQINQGQQNFSVTVSDGTGPVPCALVCLWKDDEVYCTRITSLLGKANFPINPTSSGTMYITASAQNHKKYEEDITVLGSKGITLLSFAGNRTKSGNELEWRVVKDGSVTYFNIYRRPVNPDVKIPAVSDELGGSAASRLIDNDKSALNDGFSWFKLTDVPIAITADNSYYYLDPYTGETEYEYKLEATTSSGAVELGTAKVSGNLPTTFALHQSRPNPAAGSATIAFSIPRALDVSLDVYDISGRKVATLVNGHLAEGEYERNVSGLQPGVYLYRIEAGEFNAVKKMVVK